MPQNAQTAKEMLPAIGCIVAVRADIGLVHCRVLDVKSAYGRNRLLVTPIAGQGETWIEIIRVRGLVTGIAQQESPKSPETGQKKELGYAL